MNASCKTNLNRVITHVIKYVKLFLSSIAYRDQGGLEIDFVMEYGVECEAIEAKLGRSLHPTFFANLRKLTKRQE